MSGLQLQPKTGVDTDTTYVEADEAEWLMNADIVDSLVADWNQDLSHGCYTYKTHGPQPDTDAHWKTSMIDIASMYHLSNPHDQLHETDHARGWCTCRMSRSNINNPKLYKNPRCRSYWRWLIINLSVRFLDVFGLSLACMSKPTKHDHASWSIHGLRHFVCTWSLSPWIRWGSCLRGPAPGSVSYKGVNQRMWSLW